MRLLNVTTAEKWCTVRPAGWTFASKISSYMYILAIYYTYIHMGLINILLKDIFSLGSQPTVVLVHTSNN